MTRFDGLDSRPYLVTLGLDPGSFDRLDRLRDRYFPPALNVVPAHISLFHQLPSEEGEAIRQALEEVAGAAPIALSFTSLFRLGRGIAVRVESEELRAVHGRLARAFDAHLTKQDRQPFRPHVTLMNKAEPREAVHVFDELQTIWTPWDGGGESLLLWRYLGGPWDLLESIAFRA